MSTEQEIEQEEEEQHNGRRAFFAGVHQADTFSGSFRGVPAPKRGGAASVRPEDTLGDEEHCWCGQLLGHSWPGKEQGVKHPRGETMSAAANEKPYLNPRDLRIYDRRVVRAMCELVNTYGVEYKINSNHVFLTAPHSTGQEIDERLKVSPSRAPENQLKFIERWATKFVRPAKVEEAASALAAKFNDPTKKPREKPAASTPVPEPTPEPVAPEPTPEPAPAPTPEPGGSEPLTFQGDEETDSLDFGDEPPEGYHQHVDIRRGITTNWWERDSGGKWLCKSCDFTVEGESLRGAGPHQVKHTEAPEVRSERSRQNGSHRDNEAAAKRQRARNAIKFLAAEFDVELATGKGQDKQVEKLTKQVEKLQAQVTALTTERDEAKAKFDMAKELFSL